MERHDLELRDFRNNNYLTIITTDMVTMPKGKQGKKGYRTLLCFDQEGRRKETLKIKDLGREHLDVIIQEGQETLKKKKKKAKQKIIFKEPENDWGSILSNKILQSKWQI